MAKLILMQILKRCFFMSVVLCFVGSVHAQSEVCRLTTFWVEKNPFISSSRELVAEFPLAFEDRTMAKLIPHKESGLDVSVGAELVQELDRRDAKLIRLGLAFSGQPEDVFNETQASEATSIYDKNWRFLAVTKSIEREKRVYTFSFSCERPKAKKR